MTTFALVHGAWQGAWCWDLVAHELGRRGHRTIAVDLPIENPDAGAADYADTVLDAISDVDDDLVLVGHSHGGLTVPVVAERLGHSGRTPRRMTLIAPVLPRPGRRSDLPVPDDADRIMPGLSAGQTVHDDGSSTWQPQAAIAAMYPDAPPVLAEWAAQRLRRQQWRIATEITPLRSWPRAEVSMIACAADGVVNADWVRRTSRVRFGVDAHILPGDHSPFLARPTELVDLLVA